MSDRLAKLSSVVSEVSAPWLPSPSLNSKVWLHSFEAFDSGRVAIDANTDSIKSAKKVVRADDVLFSKLNPRIPRVWHLCGPGNDRTMVASTEFVVLRRRSADLLPAYLAFMLQAPQFLDPVQAAVSSSTKSHQRVRPELILSQCIPLPDIEVQGRIVARIQDCFNRLEEMEQLQVQLGVDVDHISDASVHQIASELRNEHPSLTIGEIVAHDPTAMRSGPFGSAMKHEEFVSDGHLVIGIANVQENRFDSVRKWMINDAKFEVMRRYSVEPGDVLITIMGTIGRTCVVPDDIGSAITSKHVYRIRFPKKRVNPHYVSYLINFDSQTREQLFGTAAGGVMPGLNATKLRDLRIPLPPLKVQDRMVEQLERTHAALQEMRALHSTPDLPILRAAILREAFAGRL